MATKKVDIGETSLTDRQLAARLSEMLSQYATGSLGGDHIQRVNEHRDPFAPSEKIEVALIDRIEWWREHFKILYRINPDFSNLHIPEQVPGFDRLVIVPRGLTYRKWVETARMIHEVNLYQEDLDAVVTENNRTPKDRSYGVWIRDRQEADEELKGKSANVLVSEKIYGVTLLERLVAGTSYLFDKMSHMDRDNVTLCSGSRYSDGGVPSVYWNADGRRLLVSWYSASISNSDLRSRAVVS